MMNRYNIVGHIVMLVGHFWTIHTKTQIGDWTTHMNSVLKLLVRLVRFFGSYQRLRAVAAMYGVKTVFILG